MILKQNKSSKSFEVMKSIQSIIFFKENNDKTTFSS